MSLIDDFTVPCTLLERRRTTDGEGGWATQWVDGPQFEAAITLDNSTQARVAQAEGVTNVYTITTSRATPLSFHDVLRRDADGKVFRVTSDGIDKRTPASAGLDMTQVSAEEWVLA